MTQLFLTYISVALAVSVLIVVLVLVRPLLQKCYRARLLGWLWLVLAVRLLLPVRFELPAAQAPVQLEVPQTEYVVLVDAQRLPDLAAPEPPAAPVDPTAAEQEIWQQEQVDYQKAMTAYEQEMTEARRNAGMVVTLPQVLCGVWLVGVVMLAVWQAIAYRYEKKKLLKNALLLPEMLVMEALRAELGVRCAVPVLQSTALTTPLVLGLVRPRLLLPARPFDETELEMVLRHELTHIRRGDIAYKLVMNLAVLVHWYNPLVWLARRLAAQDIELACDETVLAGKNAVYRAAYADSVFKTAASTALHKNGRAPLLSTGFANDKDSLKQRFSAICSRVAKRPGRAVLVAAVCIVLLAGGLVTAVVKRQPSERPAQTTPQWQEDGQQTVLSQEQLVALEQTRSWRTAFYKDPLWLEDWAQEMLQTKLVTSEIWGAGQSNGEEIQYYVTDIRWESLISAQESIMGEALADEMRSYAFDEGKNLFYFSTKAGPLVLQDCLVGVNMQWIQEGMGTAQGALPEYEILQAEEESVLLHIEPEAWEQHAQTPAEVRLVKQEDGRWRVASWPAPVPEDCWRDAKLQLQHTKTLGSWNGRTYTVINDTMQCADATGVLWTQNMGNPTVDGWFCLEDAGTAGEELLFVENGYRLLCFTAEGGKEASEMTEKKAMLRCVSTERLSHRQILMELQLSGAETGTRWLRYDVFEQKWVWAQENGLAADGSDLYSRLAVTTDERWEVWLVASSDKLVLRDTVKKENRIVWAGTWPHGNYTSRMKFLENGDLCIIMQDELTIYTAASEYRTQQGLNMSFAPEADEPVRLHTVRRDPVSMEYLVLYSCPVNGGEEYIIAHCDAGGTPTAQYPTGVRVVWFDAAARRPSGTYFALEGDTLTVLREYGIMPYDSEPVFRFDLANHTVEDLSDRLMGQW